MRYQTQKPLHTGLYCIFQMLNILFNMSYKSCKRFDLSHIPDRGLRKQRFVQGHLACLLLGWDLTRNCLVYSSHWATNDNIFFFWKANLLEPVGNGHHHVQRSQEEHKVKIGIAVHSALFFIINYFLATPSINMHVSICCINQKTKMFIWNSLIILTPHFSIFLTQAEK